MNFRPFIIKDSSPNKELINIPIKLVNPLYLERFNKSITNKGIYLLYRITFLGLYLFRIIKLYSK